MSGITPEQGRVLWSPEGYEAILDADCDTGETVPLSFAEAWHSVLISRSH